MIYSLTVKNLGFFLQIQQFISAKEFCHLKIVCDPTVFEDIKAICNSIKEFSNVNVLVSNDVKTNLINEKKFTDFALKTPLQDWNCKLTLNSFNTVPKLDNKKYIYLEDYRGDYDLHNFATAAQKMGLILYSTVSLKKVVPNVIIDKTKYNIIEKLGIMQNSSGYVGYDYSNYGPIAYKFRNRFFCCILRTNTMIDEELLLKYYPARDLSFLYNNLGELIAEWENAKN